MWQQWCWKWNGKSNGEKEWQIANLIEMMKKSEDFAGMSFVNDKANDIIDGIQQIQLDGYWQMANLTVMTIVNNNPKSNCNDYWKTFDNGHGLVAN